MNEELLFIFTSRAPSQCSCICRCAINTGIDSFVSFNHQFSSPLSNQAVLSLKSRDITNSCTPCSRIWVLLTSQLSVYGFTGCNRPERAPAVFLDMCQICFNLWSVSIWGFNNGWDRSQEACLCGTHCILLQVKQQIYHCYKIITFSSVLTFVPIWKERLAADTQVRFLPQYIRRYIDSFPFKKQRQLSICSAME